MPTLPGHVYGGGICGLRELVRVQVKDVSRRKIVDLRQSSPRKLLTKQRLSVDAVRSGWAVASSG
jgi:hypothetical protein